MKKWLIFVASLTATTLLLAYSIRISAMESEAPHPACENLCGPNAQSTPDTGRILWEWWTGVSGKSISDLKTTYTFPDNASGIDNLWSFEAPRDWGDYYGTRIESLLVAPVDGEYVFWIASDDNSELWLSTDDDPENRERIAHVPGWTNPREWDKYPEQRSRTRELRRGQYYYIEVLHKEHTGHDHLAVAWQYRDEPRQVIVNTPLGQSDFSYVITREWWLGIPGRSVSDLNNPRSYPDNPSCAKLLTSFETPSDRGDYYGSRVRGYIHPPESGPYTFWIASDDYGELWLSSDDDPAKSVRIAHVPGWTDRREWGRYAEQQSQPITLEAGRKYYIEALHKEQTDHDHLAVAWQIPGGSREVIPGRFLSPFQTSVFMCSPRFVSTPLPTDTPTSIPTPVPPSELPKYRSTKQPILGLRVPYQDVVTCEDADMYECSPPSVGDDIESFSLDNDICLVWKETGKPRESERWITIVLFRGTEEIGTESVESVGWEVCRNVAIPAASPGQYRIQLSYGGVGKPTLEWRVATPLPTHTPTPTDAPTPANMPTPTNTPTPTDTPAPPTDAPEPSTATPEAAATPASAITGIILLQGRTTHAGTDIFLTEGPCPDSPSGDPTTVTNEEGSFRIMPLPGRIYGCLQAFQPGYLLGQSVSPQGDLGTLELLGGDASQDNVIDIFDLSRITARFDSSDPMADLNADNVVDIFDLSMVTGNFDKEGPISDWR